ncbi:MAG: hypothetical protein HYY37_00355 [Candidatus Aenigmarchaeota archaeon]|nr:hypothetical protein [Candidatus Aenigmarchaeota archaeon]
MPYRNNNYRDNRLVDRIDAAVLRLHENIARYWQNTTYRSKDVLAKGLNATSLACCTVNIGSIPLTKNYEDLIFSIPLGAAQARRLVSRGRQKTTLEADAERIRRDVYDELYDTKIPRLVVLTGGLYALGGGGGGEFHMSSTV